MSYSKSIFFTIFLSVTFLLVISCKKENSPKAIELTINEGFKNPISFFNAAPSFSWKLPINSEIKSQSAYHIVVGTTPGILDDNQDLWDSKKQFTDQSTYIKYDGKPLVSRQKVYWAVKFWDQNDKESAWSEINSFELGLLQNSDWEAQWIGLDTQKNADTTATGFPYHKIQYLRKDFELPSDIVSARLYTTAKGVFDAMLNGKSISNDVMPPGWTPYHKRIETLTYDVTNLLKTGKNTLAYILAPGWHSGRLGWEKEHFKFENPPRILSQLEVTFKDGSVQKINSDNSWKATINGPITFSDIYDGEIYNANYEIPEWNLPDHENSSWKKVLTEAINSKVLLSPKRHSTVKIKDTLSTIAITKPDSTSTIFDMGQNMVGVPLLNVPVKKGDTLTIRFAEMLQKDGTIYTENYRTALSTDYYIPKANETISWSPKFTFHGFRYVALSGYDTTKSPEKNWVTGLVQYSDFKEQGTFTSSHKKLNQLQSNINWGLRGNFYDIPTDCPQRDERLGWTGDAQVFAPTSLFNADVHAFWASWLQSVREEQGKEGQVPFIVPNILNPNAVSSGWGDAAVIIPWELYQRTGDISVLEENFEMMQRWVAFHQLKSENHISNMYSFADWLQPFQKAKNLRGDTPKDFIGTAYNAYVTKLTMQAAKILNKPQEEAKYQSLFNTIQKVFQQQFFDQNGQIKEEETQTGYLLALAFDLLSDDIKQKAIPHLLRKIEEADNHLRTGFLGTPLLSKVLDEIGKVDLMYTILFKETYPSWFYSINQGATTMWERWNSYSHEDGFGDAGMNSFNHYAYGAIGQWMYERIAGIAPLAPGYKKIRIAPIPGGPLTSASASYKTIYGEVSSSWKINEGTFYLETIIPPNTTAVVRLPTNNESEIRCNGKALTDSKTIKSIKKIDGYTELEVMAGKHQFLINNKL